MAFLPAPDFSSIEENNYNAVLNIIARHPMEENDIRSFIQSRVEASFAEELVNEILIQLKTNRNISVLSYGEKSFFRFEN